MKAKTMTDCAIIGNYCTKNFAIAVEILNTVIHTWAQVKYPTPLKKEKEEKEKL